MLRRTLLSLAGGVAASALLAGGAIAAGLPPLAEKPTYKVGFAQTESNNPWRLAADREHEGRGREARLTSWSTPTPPARPPSRSPTSTRMIAQRRRLDLPAAARGEAADPGGHGRQEGRHPGDPARPQRRPDARQGRRGLRHLHRLGLRRGRQARRRVAGQGRERQGQDHRARGHHRLLAGQRPQEGLRRRTSRQHPGMEIVACQSGDFARDKGRQVAETLLQAHPDATVDLRPQRRDGDRRDRGASRRPARCRART